MLAQGVRRDRFGATRESLPQVLHFTGIGLRKMPLTVGEYGVLNIVKF
jgi:hypothetical protein